MDHVAARKPGWWPNATCLKKLTVDAPDWKRLDVILDKLEDLITIWDMLARLAAVRHARHAAAVAFDSLLESRSTPSASSWIGTR